MDQGGGSELDIESEHTDKSTKTDTEKAQQTQQYPEMPQKLQMTFNPSFSRPQNRVRQPRTLNQVYKTKEFIFNASTTSDPGIPTSMQEALDGADKES